MIIILLAIVICAFIGSVIAIVAWDLRHQDESEAENHEHSIGTKDNDHD